MIILVNNSLFASKELPLSGHMHLLRTNDPQCVSMGYTGVAYCNELSSSDINPACISNVDKLAFHYSYYPATKDWGDLKFNQFSTSLGIRVTPKNIISIHYKKFNFGKFYPSSGNSGIQEIKITTSHSLNITKDNLSIGLSLKYLEEYGSFRDYTILFDFGFKYTHQINHNIFSFGGSLINLGEDLKMFDEAIFDNPINLLRLGLSYNWNDILNDKINLLSSIEYQKSILNKEERHYGVTVNDIRWNHIGIGNELQLFNHLYFRFGYSISFKDVSEKYDINGFTYGIGYSLPQKLNILIPVDINFAISKGLKDYRNFENILFTITISN